MNIVDFPPLLIDTREPDPHPWAPYIAVETVRAALPTGDFSLPGCEEWIALERKALDDLIGCLTTSRERFTRELQRAGRIKDFCVIVEGSYADILKGRYRSAMNSKSAWESIIALQQRFGIPFLFAGSAEIAARLAESILLRWWKEHVKVMEEAEKAVRRLQRSA
jgi:DNA excision repair protein ERCC-4